jgi:hypothetical protein
MGIYGQDWASYQSASPSTNGLGFVFIKVTEGLSYVNPEWTAQRDHARAAGLVVGYYHYPHMANSAQTEADHFLALAQPAAGELLCLDWEGYDAANAAVSHAAQLAYKEAFLRHVKAATPNSPVGMYCNTDYWNSVDTTGYVQDFLWIATSGRAAGDPGISANWLFHQYSASPIDSDFCPLASTSDLRSWALTFANGDDMPLTQADADLVAASVAARLASDNTVRDANAYAGMWWQQAALAGQVPDGASPGWASLLASWRASLGAAQRTEGRSQDVRDANAFAVHWWLQKALTATPEPGAAGQPWGDLLPELTAALQQLPAGVLTQLQAAVAEALQRTVNVEVTVAGPTAGS